MEALPDRPFGAPGPMTLEAFQKRLQGPDIFEPEIIQFQAIQIQNTHQGMAGVQGKN
jgi:hypothetical protein